MDFSHPINQSKSTYVGYINTKLTGIIGILSNIHKNKLLCEDSSNELILKCQFAKSKHQKFLTNLIYGLANRLN